MLPIRERLLRRRTMDVNGCWVWPTLSFNGYGVISAGSRRVMRLPLKIQA